MVQTAKATRSHMRIFKLGRRCCVSRQTSTLKTPFLRGGVSPGHGMGSRQGERADRQRYPSLQETVREGWYPRGAAQARALREAERATEEEGHCCAEACPPTYPRPATVARRGSVT